ncbi:RDD family protein [Fibrobacter sp. UWR2]|uniref:RDD family protein n=1 Tax=Fibrobacter sp. UWR2 TaxID=1964352 RepID=UPI000B51F1E4|nr:RDD family protein [Fibrobacter sp. UWR2]OWU99911.1 RDD family protein [Fibrobacter sp. UWR2]
MDSKRLAAILIDLVITALINNIPFFFLIILPSMQDNGLKDPTELMSRALIASMIAMLYLIFRDLPSGGSIGKMVMKLKVVDAETKVPVSAGRRILRNVPWLLNWIEIFAFIITRKRIGDRIAKTDVIAK